MNYLRIGLLFALAALLNAASPWLLQRIAHLGGTETAIASTLWCLSLFLGFGWACSKVAEGTIFPSFTIQLLIGIVLHDALAGGVTRSLALDAHGKTLSSHLLDIDID